VLVRTVAGATPGPETGFLDGGATQARFNLLAGVAVDGEGNLYLADMNNHALRRVSAAGLVSTVAGVVGRGAGAADGLGTQAQFNLPTGIAVTPDGRTLYVADSDNNLIRRVELIRSDPTQPDSWWVSTIAGAGSVGAADGPGDAATFNSPYGIALDPGGNVYVAEVKGNRVRRLQFQGGDPSVAADWEVRLVAGDNSAATGAVGTIDATGSAARFNEPRGLAVDWAGTVYVADTSNHRLRGLTPDGVVTTLAGDTADYADGTGTAAKFNQPWGVAVDSAGYLYVADRNNHRVRRISLEGLVTTVAGTGTAGSLDGSGDLAQFDSPRAIAVDAAGSLYVADGPNGNRLRLVERLISVGQMGE
jgi:DNA-binding beta-propeller fold protein YncE